MWFILVVAMFKLKEITDLKIDDAWFKWRASLEFLIVFGIIVGCLIIVFIIMGVGGYRDDVAIEGLEMIRPARVDEGLLLEDIYKKPIEYRLSDIRIPALAEKNPRNKTASYIQTTTNNIEWGVHNTGKCVPFDICPDAFYDDERIEKPAYLRASDRNRPIEVPEMNSNENEMRVGFFMAPIRRVPTMPISKPPVSYVV